MTAITAHLRRLRRLRMSDLQPLWTALKAAPGRIIAAYTVAALFSLVFITGAALAGGVTFLTVFAGVSGPALFATLFILLTIEVGQ